jgi:aspartate/methionine/tyrosine aminotransferase
MVMLSERVRLLGVSDEASRPVAEGAPEPIWRAVRAALVSGETHYTPRPGLLALRRKIAEEIAGRGGPTYDPAKAVVVTAGEQEALFTTLLGLAPGPGEFLLAARADCRHLPLFGLLGLVPRQGSGSGARFVYREAGFPSSDFELPEIFNLGDGLASKGALPSWDVARAVVVGSLDALPGVASFRVGFVAGAETVMRRVETWKQAFSICTAGPSQRAALASLESK